MEYLNWILGAIAVATGLSTLVVQLRSNLKNATIDQLKESNAAYKERNDQLDTEISDVRVERDACKARADFLESLKSPPLEELTTLVVKQHTQQQRSTNRLACEVAGLAKVLAQKGLRK